MEKHLLKGTWKLTYKLINHLGVEGFGGRMISTYADPITGKSRVLKDANGRELPGYFIEKQITIFKPEENPQDRVIVDWLVGHPLVGVNNAHTKLDKKYLDKKNQNPRITIVNLDHEDVVDLQQEDYIDKLVGKISLDNGVNAISREKLRFILSKLGLDYRYEKYRNNKDIEKQKLRKKLKDFVRSSYERAEQVNKILDNLEEAKIVYEIKEMIRLGLISNTGGMFLYEGSPLGISFESIMEKFNNDPEFYGELITTLYKKLRE